jgi:hypothetical protein
MIKCDNHQMILFYLNIILICFLNEMLALGLVLFIADNVSLALLSFTSTYRQRLANKNVLNLSFECSVLSVEEKQI